MGNLVKFHFLKPGLHSTVQDMGRPGFQEFGVPVGGAMDKQSMKTANWLVGNPAETPVLEITLLGPKIEIKGNCQIAIAGADLSPKVNDEPVPLYETLDINAGTVLSFGRLLSGCRAYLAIRGNWKLQSWLKSYSAAAYSGENTTPNNFIKKDSVLEIETLEAISKKVFPVAQRPEFPAEVKIHVLQGPDFESLSRQAIAHFFSTKYKLSPDSNRMGYRLHPLIPGYQSSIEIISSGIVPGTIQLTPSGHPIVLMMDAQTTGGYPRIANVLAADLDVLGQLKPGDFLRLEFVGSNQSDSKSH